MITEQKIQEARERYKQVNRNPLTPLNFLKRTEMVFPDRKGIVYRDRSYTWHQFAERVYRLASALKAAGVRKYDRITIISRNNNACLESFYGAGYAGAVSVPLNFRFKAPEAAYILNQSESKVLIFEHIYADEIRGIVPELRTVKTLIEIDSPDKTDGETLGIPYEEFLMRGSPESLPVPVEDENDMISITYTSGTTGPSKGCVYTHRGTYLNALGEIIQSRMTPDSAYLWTLPMFHCNGWCHVWAVTAIGALHVCLDAVRAEQIYDIMVKENVTHMCGAPTVYMMLTDFATHNNLKFPAGLHGFIAGAPPSETVIAGAENAGMSLDQLYGLSEVYGPHVISEWKKTEWDSLPLGERAKLKARQGVPTVTCTFAKVVDEEMNEVPWDGETRGEIVMRGNNVMQWYFGEHERTEKAFSGGWFHSGDCAVVFPDGYIQIVDRIKDIVNTGGEKVSSIEVENVIAQIPGVLDVAIIGKPDSKWGEIVKAVVKVSPEMEISEDDIIKFCRGKLAGWKTPREVEFADVPRTSTGKIQKNVLKQKELDRVKVG